MRALTVLLAAAAVVLTAVLVAQARGDEPDRAEPGSTTPVTEGFYLGGRATTLLVPGMEVPVQVGPSVSSVDDRMVDDSASYDPDEPYDPDPPPLGAPEGGSLVPLTWTGRLTGELGYQSVRQDVELHLVSGEERVMIGSFAVGGAPTSSDFTDDHRQVVAVSDAEAPLAVEITFDGLTQRLDVASGDVEAGVADDLYDPRPSLTSSCGQVDDDCRFQPVGLGDDLRVQRDDFIASGVSFQPWTEEDGWSEDGTLWATVYAQVFGSDGLVTREGRTFYARGQGAPRMRLDGLAPVRSELRASGAFDDTSGYTVFEVADDQPQPRFLTVRHVVELRGGAPVGSYVSRARMSLR